MEEKYVETGNGRIFYRKGGEGPPLILLHGNGEDSLLFQDFFAFFQSRFTVLAMDTRGHGRSDLGEGKLTFARIVQDIRALLQQEELPAAHLVGYSDGGNIGLYWAAHYPQQVLSLIVMGANFEADGLITESYEEILQERERFRSQEGKEAWRRLQLVNLMLEELALTETLLHRVEAPVLVMAGKQDVIKEEQTRRLAQALPNARLEIVPAGGHDFFLHQPEALKQAASCFYQKNGCLH